MKFWDASAIVPLLVRQAATTSMQALYQSDPVVVVWWGTSMECESALARLQREGRLAAEAMDRARQRLGRLERLWTEVEPSEPLRDLARRLLRVHPTRTGDAPQLAAALIAADQRPETLDLVCLDERLSAAARREGFRVPKGKAPRPAPEG